MDSTEVQGSPVRGAAGASRWRAVVSSRAGRAAAAGAGVGLFWIALTFVSWNDYFTCDDQVQWGCLGAALLFLGALLLASLLMSWLVLRLVGVRPAWRVVAAAALLFWAVTRLGRVLGSWELPEATLPVTSAALFALAAALTASGPRLRRTRIVLLGLLVLYSPLAPAFGVHL
ncbi:hypothetical protein HUT16_35635 [Kitasatospora sp. NA04385]|uniref:hypothetical protein n=1 Tax=Kitasatospora sp. NA04385 TaxID=2742135 RepID=UPI0015907569|nr:hypothetical protein [Kitasatospora sp. NA04385]QKW23725.1 hypothetical protein HUT16_35635 [Kitasatospora sp. NA04385]